MVWLLFIIGLMGLFFYNNIGSIIPMVVLPTTEIIEPLFCDEGKIYHFPFNAKVYNTVFPVTFAVIIDSNGHLSIFMTKPS